MFWQEHAPPHFHALYGEFEALFDIRTFEVIRGSLPRRALLLPKLSDLFIPHKGGREAEKPFRAITFDGLNQP